MLYDTVCHEMQRDERKPYEETEALRHTAYGFPWGTVARLFTGHSCDLNFTTAQSCAIACNGICLYYPALENMTLSPAQHHCIRVVPGGIAWNDRRYTAILGPAEMTQPQHEFSSPADVLQSFLRKTSFPLHSELLIRERVLSTTLEVWIEIVPRPSSVYQNTMSCEPAYTGAVSNHSDVVPHKFIGDVQFLLRVFKNSLIYLCTKSTMEVFAHTSDSETFLSGSCAGIEVPLWDLCGEDTNRMPRMVNGS